MTSRTCWVVEVFDGNESYEATAVFTNQASADEFAALQARRARVTEMSLLSGLPRLRWHVYGCFPVGDNLPAWRAEDLTIERRVTATETDQDVKTDVYWTMNRGWDGYTNPDDLLELHAVGTDREDVGRQWDETRARAIEEFDALKAYDADPEEAP